MLTEAEMNLIQRKLEAGIELATRALNSVTPCNAKADLVHLFRLMEGARGEIERACGSVWVAHLRSEGDEAQ